MAKFDRGNIIIGGAVCAELQDGSVEIRSGDKMVSGMQGVLGTVSGTITGTITAKRAMPLVGFKDANDLTAAIMKHQEVTFMAVSANKKFAVTGTLEALKWGWSEGSACMEDVSLNGAITVQDR